MGKQQDFVNKALSHIGDNGQKTWNFMGFRDEWCAGFVSQCANEVGGLLGKVIYKTWGAGDFARYGTTSSVTYPGKWYEAKYQGGTTQPQPGDIITFTWNGLSSYTNIGKDKYFSDHVGIVYAVDSKYVYTIEGNTSGSNFTSTTVAKKYYKLDSGFINGYFRPDWAKVSDTSAKDAGAFKIEGQAIPSSIKVASSVILNGVLSATDGGVIKTVESGFKDSNGKWLASSIGYRKVSINSSTYSLGSMDDYMLFNKLSNNTKYTFNVIANDKLVGSWPITVGTITAAITAPKPFGDVKVTGATSYLRQDAAVNAKVLATHKVGESLKWLKDDGWGWSQCQNSAGVKGWIQNSRITDKSGLTSWRRGTFTGSGILNVRDKASTSGSRIITKILPKGTFTIISFETQPNKEVWIRTNINGIDRFICYDKNYISISGVVKK